MYGALAGLPWAVIMGSAIPYMFTYERVPPLMLGIAGFIAMSIVALPLGAIGGLLFVKIQERIPARSTLRKAVVLSLVVWGILNVPYTASTFNYTFAVTECLGLLIWARVFTYFIDKELDQTARLKERTGG